MFFFITSAGQKKSEGTRTYDLLKQVRRSSTLKLVNPCMALLSYQRLRETKKNFLGDLTIRVLDYAGIFSVTLNIYKKTLLLKLESKFDYLSTYMYTAMDFS